MPKSKWEELPEGLRRELKSISTIAELAKLDDNERTSNLGELVLAQLAVLKDYLSDKDLKLENLVTILSAVSTGEQRVTSAMRAGFPNPLRNPSEGSIFERKVAA